MDNEYSSYLIYEYAKTSSDIGFNYYTQLKNHISKSYSNIILDKKTGEVGI